MNRKAQFFIIFAVILGLLLLGTATLFNTIKTKDYSSEFFRTCNNYKHEVFMITQNANAEHELEHIKTLTNFFVNEKDLEIFFIYGTREETIIFNKFKEKISFKRDGITEEISPDSERTYSNLNIDLIEFLSPITRPFEITENRNVFMVVRRNQSGKEVYYC